MGLGEKRARLDLFLERMSEVKEKERTWKMILKSCPVKRVREMRW